MILTQRVRRDRMSLDFLWIMRYDELKQEATKSCVPFAGPKDPYAACWDFITRLQQWNVRNYVYITPVQWFIDNLKSKFPKPLPTKNAGGH